MMGGMPSGRTLAFVVAHPDDDAYGIAGAVALHADDPDFRFVLVHATDGEGGDIRKGFPATPETLGAIRRKEDESAWRALGRLPDRHVWLGLPDGGLSQMPFDELVEAVGTVLDEEQPTVVGTFGPDGIFGHPDHIAIGAATDVAFAQRASTTGHSFRRLLHGVIPNSVFERWQAQRAAMGRELFDPTQMYHMRGVPDENIGIVLDCRPVSDRIVAGLLEHKSQHHVFFDDTTETDRWKRVVSRLWFDVAWPPRPSDAQMLTDIFEGLS
jgi:N-acetyl-1-D-myo-inositol-2-amino-2-deoxy-alpha-D-glucopyranoside deacetylase